LNSEPATFRLFLPPAVGLDLPSNQPPMTWHQRLAVGLLVSLQMVTTSANIQHSDVDAAEGVVEGVAFVLIAGVFLAIGAVALVYRRQRRDAAKNSLGLAIRHADGHVTPSGSGFSSAAASPSRPDHPHRASWHSRQHDFISPSAPGREAASPPGPMTHQKSATSSFITPEHDIESTFTCSFLDGADMLLEDSVERDPAAERDLDKQVFKALKQWRPPRVKPRLSDESRRRISAMSSSANAKSKRSTSDLTLSV